MDARGGKLPEQVCTFSSYWRSIDGWDGVKGCFSQIEVPGVVGGGASKVALYVE